jgi:hypothetical protein
MTTTLTAITLPCPLCGEADAAIALNLATLDDTAGDNFTCKVCDVDFSIDTVRQLMARWSKVLSWIETAPRIEA